ncbi:MAG: 30S ribosomal protein S16 [Planctomycetota bacterium]
MVRIRLTRTGRKNLPLFRIGVFDSRTRRDGRSIENLGTYNPRADEEAKKIVLKKDRLDYWLGHGAQLTPSLESIFKKTKTLG